MNSEKIAHLFNHTVDELSDCLQLEKSGFLHECKDSDPIPSAMVLKEIIDLCRAVFFPGYFGKPSIDRNTLKFHVGVNIERIHTLLLEQIEAGLLTQVINGDDATRKNLVEKTNGIALQFIENLPRIRHILETDVIAAFNGDPAATGYGEVISCYPIIKALTNYRVAHLLHLLGVPLIPRIITEMAHSETGIDIHPEAEIGSYFTIDHGTGVVIGATTIIGNHVKLYQGVTLGAKSFPLDENGNPIKGIKRHPIIEDDVIIYSNATILGRITIGKGAVIGGNVWVTEDVPAEGKVVQANKQHMF